MSVHTTQGHGPDPVLSRSFGSMACTEPRAHHNEASGQYSGNHHTTPHTTVMSVIFSDRERQLAVTRLPPERLKWNHVRLLFSYSVPPQSGVTQQLNSWAHRSSGPAGYTWSGQVSGSGASRRLKGGGTRAELGAVIHDWETWVPKSTECFLKGASPHFHPTNV